MKTIYNCNKPLDIKIEDDQLVIRVGVDAMVSRIVAHPSWPGGEVTDTLGFAQDMAKEMRIKHRNQMALEEFFDTMADLAVEAGSKHFLPDPNQED